MLWKVSFWFLIFQPVFVLVLVVISVTKIASSFFFVFFLSPIFSFLSPLFLFLSKKFLTSFFPFSLWLNLSPPLTLDTESFTKIKEVRSTVTLGEVRSKLKLSEVRSKTKLSEVRSKGVLIIVFGHQTTMEMPFRAWGQQRPKTPFSFLILGW